MVEMVPELHLIPCYPPLSMDSDSPSCLSQDSTEQPFTIIGDSKRKKFLCNVPDCQKIFRYKSEIDRHVATHSDIRPQRCAYEDCKKSFKRTDALENHIRSQHTGEAPLVCPHQGCGKSFTTNAKLRYHTISHMGQKPFVCGFPGCEKSFMTLSQIKQHQRSTLVHRKIVNTDSEKQENDQDIFEVIQKRPLINEKDSPLIKKVKIEVNENKEPVEKIIPLMERVPEVRKCGEEARFVMNRQPFPHQMQQYQPYHHQGGYLREGEDKTFFFTQVMHDNESLKRKLELSEKMVNQMNSQMKQFTSVMYGLLQNKVTKDLCLPFFMGGENASKYGKQHEIMMSSTEDVDSYFLVNNKPEAEFFSDVSLTTSADSLENDSPPKSQQDLDYFTFSNIN